MLKELASRLTRVNIALYSVTYSRLSKSDSNIDVPLARPVRAGRSIGRDATARSLQSGSEPEAVTAETVLPVLKMQPT
jgi:hypothetical protein